MNDPPARNTGQHQCIANDVPSILPSILLIYSFCVQPVFVYWLRFRLILRLPGIQRIQEFGSRRRGAGTALFITMSTVDEAEKAGIAAAGKTNRSRDYSFIPEPVRSEVVMTTVDRSSSKCDGPIEKMSLFFCR